MFFIQFNQRKTPDDKCQKNRKMKITHLELFCRFLDKRLNTWLILQNLKPEPMQFISLFRQKSFSFQNLDEVKLERIFLFGTNYRKYVLRQTVRFPGNQSFFRENDHFPRKHLVFQETSQFFRKPLSLPENQLAFQKTTYVVNFPGNHLVYQNTSQLSRKLHMQLIFQETSQFTIRLVSFS